MDKFQKYYDHALRFLSYRPRSEKEIKDNLLRFKSRKGRKGIEKGEETGQEIIDQVINKLKEQSFVNDEEFTRWWIEQRITFRPRGLRLIKMELRKKGISDNLINNILQNSEFRIQNDLENVKKLVEKRLSRYKGLEKKEVYQKLWQFLVGKGFDYDTIKEVVDEVLKKGV